MLAQETVIRAFPNADHPLITYGLPFHEACRSQADQLNASRIYVIVSATLARTTSSFEELKTALGSKVVGERTGMKPHTYMSDVLFIVEEVRSLKANLIVTLGGGSLSDGAKCISMAVANECSTPGDLKKLPHSTNLSASATAPTIPIICIPMTLSAGEYSAWAGVTEDATGLKFQFINPLKSPRVIILDGELVRSMPIRTWIGSGVRALDHCVEALCGLENSTEDGKRIPESDEACIEGLKELIPGLLRCKANADDAEARFKCQLGANKSLTPLHMGVMAGASHGIGHMLGPFGVPHGETSCILLPAVCRFNANHFSNSEEGAEAPGLKRQQIVHDVLWSIPEAVEVFSRRELSKNDDLSTLLDSLISELGMPRHLQDVGIGKEKFDEIAANALQDSFLQTSPVPFNKGDEARVKEILEMCS